MSILDRDLNNEQVDPAKMAAKRLLMMTKQSFQQMAQAYNQGAKICWDNPNATASGILAELGTDAAEVCTLHYLLGQLLGQVKPESIAAGLAVIGRVTLNEDGTATVTPSGV